MALYTIKGETLTDIGDAIRAKLGTEEAISPLDMPEAISSIENNGMNFDELIAQGVLTIDREDEDAGIAPYINADQLGGLPASDYALKADTVFSVNGIDPDENGNIELGDIGSVKTVNGVEPDINGEIQLTAKDVGSLFSDPREEETSNPELSGIAINADMLGGINAGSYATKDYVTVAITNAKLDGEEVDLSEFMLKTDTAINSEKLGGKAPQYYIQPRNLLDNSDFRNPVNQRGQTSYTDSWAYCIDRWITENATATIENGGITVSSGYLVQRLLKTNMDINIPYTLAVCDTNGNIYVGNDAGSVLGMEDSLFDFITIKLNAGKTYKWACLYEGTYTADTLPPYVPKGYGVELAECLRYFERKFFKTVTINQTNMYMVADYVEKRIVPSITGVITDSSNITNPTIGLWNIEKNIVNGIFGSLTTPTVQAHCYGYFDISADL